MVFICLIGESVDLRYCINVVACRLERYRRCFGFSGAPSSGIGAAFATGLATPKNENRQADGCASVNE